MDRESCSSMIPMHVGFIYPTSTSQTLYANILFPLASCVYIYIYCKYRLNISHYFITCSCSYWLIKYLLDSLFNIYIYIYSSRVYIFHLPYSSKIKCLVLSSLVYVVLSVLVIKQGE